MRKGARKHQQEKNKDAMNQLRNFANIIQSMQMLDKLLEEYPGHLTEDNILDTAKLINVNQGLKLDDNQVNIVVNKFLNPVTDVSRD